MKRSSLVVLVFLLGFVLFMTLFGFSTTGLVTMQLMQKGNQMHYVFSGVGDMIQCIDIEPENDIYKKGSCHTNLRTKEHLYGIGSMDFCKSEKEVVDYYCSTSLTCTEVVNECPEDYSCEDGRCTQVFRPYKNFDIREWGKKFRKAFFETY